MATSPSSSSAVEASAPMPQPMSHAYLGELQDVEHIAQSYYPEGAVVKLPLIILPDIVLFPGDELPLRMLSDASIATIRAQLRGDGVVLAVLCAYQEGDAAYGTTVRIEKFSVADHGAAVTGAAKQRFRVRSNVLWSPRSQLMEVEILPHPSAQRMPFCVPRALLAHAPPGRVQHQPFVAHWGRREFALFDVHTLVTRIQRTFASSAQWTWFCAASREPVRVQQHRHTVTLGLTRHYLQRPSEQQDASAFAYWVAGNLPLALTERLALLRMDSVAQLLRAELALLAKCGDDILCSRCGALLAHTRDIFSVTRHGAGGTFVNPGGFVFQVLTLRAVQQRHVDVELVRSTQDSWFPGYAWSIAYCHACKQHLGWQFDVVEGQSNDDGDGDDDDGGGAERPPACFFGLRRAALTQSSHSDGGGVPRRRTHDDDDDDDDDDFDSSDADDGDDGDEEDDDDSGSHAYLMLAGDD